MKKIISAILAAVSILTITSYARAPRLTDEQADDLGGFGIMTGDPDGNRRLEDNITRAEAVKMICTAGNLKVSTLEDEACIFPDVSAEHWAYDYINTAESNNIVSGDENGFFNPESNVTNEEIIKMITSLIGYGYWAEQNGSFPSGYTSIASKLGITADMQFDINTAAVRNDVAVMIYRALDIPLLIQQVDEDGNDIDDAYVMANGTSDIPYITLRKKL